MLGLCATLYRLSKNVFPIEISINKFTRQSCYLEIGIDFFGKKVIEYRKFKDMDYAKKRLEQKVAEIPKARRFWVFSDLAMIYFLIDDFENGVSIFQNYFNILERNFYFGDVYIERNEKNFINIVLIILNPL